MYIQHAFTARAVMRIDRYLRSIVVKSYNRRKLMKRINSLMSRAYGKREQVPSGRALLRIMTRRLKSG